MTSLLHDPKFVVLDKITKPSNATSSSMTVESMQSLGYYPGSTIRQLIDKGKLEVQATLGSQAATTYT